MYLTFTSHLPLPVHLTIEKRPFVAIFSICYFSFTVIQTVLVLALVLSNQYSVHPNVKQVTIAL